MPALDPSLRDQLAAVVGKENRDDGARAIAEAGARAALEALAVHLAAPHPHLDEQARALRNRLRARARQLGDARLRDGGHDIGHLVEQCAYEHWHRMLFARFLAENDLLIHPEYRTAVTLAECAELAPADGARDAWELAARYASGMLPQIFRADDPVLDVRLPPEHVHELERLLASLPAEVFKASDSLGWVYQFWQARRKKEVNASEVKIGADELPAVTQLFTEPYMVQFLLQNTLGAWWVGAGRALPVEMPYLRTLDDGTPAAGRFEGWPKHARELKVLDPCCGSGHFLVAAFDILVPFRMQEEKLSPREACDAVLRENLYGLELDYRCTQIAAFALALAAWTYPGVAGWRPLPAINVSCSGLAISAKKDDWVRLAGSDDRLRRGMARLHELFLEAPVLGSLIDPTRDPPDPLLTAAFEELQPLLVKALAAENVATDPEEHEIRVAAKGAAEAARFLSNRYHLLATNVPYLVRLRQGPRLVYWADRWHKDARLDLATIFLERLLAAVETNGALAAVTPLNWGFLDKYKKFRKRLLRELTWSMYCRLGPGAFEQITGEVVNVGLYILTKTAASESHVIRGVDAYAIPGSVGKESALRTSPLSSVAQASLLRGVDARVGFVPMSPGKLLAAHADSYHGISTTDYARFGRCFWEIALDGVDGRWIRQQSTVNQTCLYGGREHALLWEDGKGALADLRRQGAPVVITGMEAWQKRGVAVSQMGSLPVTLYDGHCFDDNTAVVVPKDQADLPAVWAFCSSSEFREAIRAIDSSIKVTYPTMVKVEFDLPTWRTFAHGLLPQGLPPPFSEDPSQWVFRGAVVPSTAPLHVAVARLLGYRWPDQAPDQLDAFVDDDGIVCIPTVRGERTAPDRLVDVLARAYGSEWYPQRVQELLAAVGFSDRMIDDWLRNGFFEQHCRLFHQRPFIWQVWDGHREGFSALLNYHRLDRKALESLAYTYLGDWIAMQDRANKAGESGAGDRLIKARALQKKLEVILEGEAPHDIFVRWKPLARQPIGWEPDLDDGVRLNIRPFVVAGVFRSNPNITWGKDRGKNPPRSPWGEERNNDVHLTLAEKRKARGLT